jgi:hypothetical protein
LAFSVCTYIISTCVVVVTYFRSSDTSFLNITSWDCAWIVIITQLIVRLEYTSECFVTSVNSTCIVIITYFVNSQTSNLFITLSNFTSSRWAGNWSMNTFSSCCITEIFSTCIIIRTIYLSVYTSFKRTSVNSTCIVIVTFVILSSVNTVSGQEVAWIKSTFNFVITISCTYFSWCWWCTS